MKNSYSISIPKPCGENWNNFSPKENGRHCSSCNKVVVDFTKMSDRQILEFLEHKKSNTCGRFRHDQMKTYDVSSAPKINQGFTFLKAGLMSMVFALISKEADSQEIVARASTTQVHDQGQRDSYSIKSNSLQVVQGIVTSSEDNSPLPGVSVIIKGTTIGTSTDSEGRFRLDYDFKEGDVLFVSFIGYRTEEYTITKAMSGQIEIPMALELDVDLMGELAVEGVYAEPSAIGKLWNKVKSIF
jgi:hypothetical protein